jgi:hypothetical protein
MFDWFVSLFSGHEPGIVYPPYAPPVDPNDLPYESAGALLHRQPDVPFHNKFWDYPLKGRGLPEIEYSERMFHVPLFSSKHQIVNDQCVGKLHFTKSLNPNVLEMDPSDSAVMLRPRGFVISSAVPQVDKCASIEAGGAVPVNYRIGGQGPGGPEMSFQGLLSSTEYQKFGPHFLGKRLDDGSFCIEPSAVEARNNSVIVINGDDENVPVSIIRTS